MSDASPARADRGPVLVATDGTPAASGALRVARRLELRDGVPVEVVTVAEPIPIFDAGFGVSLPEAQLHESRRQTLDERARGQIREIRESEGAWPLHVMDGLAAPSIVRKARELQARRILLGLGRHGIMERFLGTETALRVVRLADCPVVAVPAGTDRLPRVAVAAIDFSEFSVRAVRAALPLLKTPAHLHLVHVTSGVESLPFQNEEWRGAYDREVGERLAALEKDLSLPEAWRVSTVVRNGEPSQEVVGYARQVEADVIVAGSHGHSFVGRLVLGSVSTRILRGAECAVLVAPPAEPPEEIEEEPVTEEEREWLAGLDAFRRRHAGRPVRVELHDPDLGAQHSSVGLPLSGLDYDARRDRFVVVLGREEPGAPGLTHTVKAPRSMETVETDGGEALRIGLERGFLLLRAAGDGGA